MEASVAGAPPAVADPTAQPQTAEPVAPVQPTPTEPIAPQQGQAEEGDLRGSFAEMKQSFDQFMESQNSGEDTSLATDLLTALEGPESEEPQVPTEPTADQAQLQGPEAQQQLSELQAFIGSQVQELVTPLQRELAARDMEALGQKYPDITSPEVLPDLTTQLNELVALTGNHDLIFNKAIVERTYKMVKAELADAGAVPAEQAATQGASLETHAGQSQAGDSPLSDQYKSEVYKTRAPSVFG